MHPMGHEHGPEVVHSMVLFGDQALYLMHMAAFDEPHNEQVVVEVGLAKDAEDPEGEYRKDHKSTGSAMYSVEPQKMHLSSLEPGASFTGDVHRGNFEAHRDPIIEGVTITVKKVVRFAELDPSTKPDSSAGRRYLCFGLAGELFAVHEITSRPSFDQVIAITIDDPEIAKQSFPTATPLRLSGKDDQASRLKPEEVADAHLPEAIGPNGESGVGTKIVAGDEVFFDDAFLG